MLGVTETKVDDLAAEMEVPRSVVLALADGDAPLCAALDSGVDFVDAVTLVESLGLRQVRLTTVVEMGNRSTSKGHA